MKKKTLLIGTLLILVSVSTIIYAQTGYSFDIRFTGDITVNETKEAEVVLKGENATLYQKVRIKVELISGPSTPTIIATDTNSQDFNILEIGYWGPAEGFQVGGTFENVTPVKATFADAGSYVIRLSLLDLDNSNAVITTRDFTLTVTGEEQQPEVNNTITTTNNTTVNEIPQTGTSVGEYAAYIIIIAAIILVGYMYIRKRNSI